MQVFLYKDAKDQSIHGSENQKTTGCRINLMKPENIARFSKDGTADDAEGLFRISCAKCQDLFIKKMLKADNKMRAQQAKEERRRQKEQGDNDNMVSLAEVQEKKRKEAEREAQRAAAAEAEAKKKAEEAKQRAEEEAKLRAREEELQKQREAELAQREKELAAREAEIASKLQYQEYVAPKKKPAPQPAVNPGFPGFALDSDLAQFALPSTGQDPTAAAFAANEGKNPNVLASMNNTAKSDVNAIMKEFGVDAAPKPAASFDDLMAEFGIPTPAAPAPAAPAGDIDLMAMFGGQEAPTAPPPVRAMQQAPEAAPAPAPVQAQAPAPQAAAPVIAGMEDLMAAFSVPQPAAPAPAPAPAPVQAQAPAPAPTPTAPVISGMEDLMAEFGLDAPKAPAPAPAPVQAAPAPAPEKPAPAPAPVVSGMEDMDDMMAALNSLSQAAPAPAPAPAPVQAAPAPAPAPAAPVISGMEDLMAEFSLDAPKAAPAPAPVQEAPAPAPAPTPVQAAPAPAPAPAAPAASMMDDLMAEFSLGASAAPASAPAKPAPPAPPAGGVQDLFNELGGGSDDMDDLMAKFTAPKNEPAPAPAPAEPAATSASAAAAMSAPVSDEMDDLMARFSAPVQEPAPAAPAASASELFGEMLDSASEDDDVIETQLVESMAPVVEKVEEPEVDATDDVAAMADIADDMFNEPAPAPQPVVHQPAPAPAPAPVAPAPAAAAPQQPAAKAPAAPQQPAAAAQSYPNAQQMGAAAGVMMQQGMPQMMPQFMGYDAAGQPMYAQPMQQSYPQVQQPVFAQPGYQFMGYDAAGKPMYAPIQQPMFQQTPVQPVQQTPVQPVQQTPVQPVQQTPVKPVQQTPVQPAPMMRPMPQPAPGGQGVHVSVIGQNAGHMPDAVRSAVARSATAPQANIFDKQGKAVPVMDNIEDILSSMGEDTSSMKKKEEEKVADIAYEEYKPRNRKAPRKKAADKTSQPDRPLTAQELKEKKRRDKIDAQFKKDLAKKGF